MSIDAQFIFMRTIPHLDRDGLISGNPTLLHAKAAPLLPVFYSKMESIINEWIQFDFVQRYKDGKRDILFFKGFAKNQVNMRYEREGESAFHPPPGYIRKSKWAAKGRAHRVRIYRNLRLERLRQYSGRGAD